MTISAAIEDFFSQLKQNVSEKTYRQYESVMSYWVSFLAGYHPEDLQAYDGPDEYGWKAYQLRAPAAKMMDYTGEFLAYFVPRKIHPSTTEATQINRGIKKLHKWMLSEGLLNADAPVDSEVGDDLAQCAKASDIMNQYGAMMLGRPITDQEEECQFIIDSVERDHINLNSFMDEKEYHRILTSPEALKILKEGWSFSGVLGKKDGKCYVMEVWTMYP